MEIPVITAKKKGRGRYEVEGVMFYNCKNDTEAISKYLRKRKPYDFLIILSEEAINGRK